MKMRLLASCLYLASLLLAALSAAAPAVVAASAMWESAYYYYYLLLSSLGRISLAQVILPIATDFLVALSVFVISLSLECRIHALHPV